jgi:hypothetical protein
MVKVISWILYLCPKRFPFWYQREYPQYKICFIRGKRWFTSARFFPVAANTSILEHNDREIEQENQQHKIKSKVWPSFYRLLSPTSRGQCNPTRWNQECCSKGMKNIRHVAPASRKLTICLIYVASMTWKKRICFSMQQQISRETH